ncbi:MAG: transposon-encoded TnpW family protein [Clostridia bacterium]|jgi:hypothetical protein|nr:transposon-encoded TnpW family protein [Clostridia bacterium]
MYITQRIGNTVYRVKVTVSESGTQTLEDILLRLIRNDTLANSGECGIIALPQEGYPQLERIPS